MKFSIIVPIFNCQKYLTKCINSLRNQTYKNLEIICIDDGSTDNSKQIIEEFSKQDKRIKLITQQNQGVSVARNNGIKIATGEYIMFVDADDWLDFNTCEILYHILQNQNEIDIIWFQTRVWENPHFSKYQKTPLLKNKFYRFSDKIFETYKSFTFLSACDKSYKTSFLKQNNILFTHGIKCFEDGIFVTKVFLSNPQIYMLNIHLYNYLMNHNSVTHKNAYDVLKMNLEGYYSLQNMFSTSKVDFLDKVKIMSFDYFLNNICSLWTNLYFSKYKQEYLDILNTIENAIKNLIENNSDKLLGLQNLKFNKQISKYHLSWLYWKIVRPICKYCIVLPYRKLKYLLGGKNEK